jgi:hypothetical protein
LIAQGGVVIEHRGYDGGGHTDIAQVKDVIGSQIEGRLRILDVGQDDVVADAGFCKPNHVGGSWGDTG